MPNFICDSWYCLIFQKKKKTQKVIWILNGSLLLEEHATKRTKFTPKCLKHRENQDIFFCVVTTRVIPKSSLQNIMRIFWVFQGPKTP